MRACTRGENGAPTRRDRSPIGRLFRCRSIRIDEAAELLGGERVLFPTVVAGDVEDLPALDEALDLVARERRQAGDDAGRAALAPEGDLGLADRRVRHAVE